MSHVTSSSHTFFSHFGRGGNAKRGRAALYSDSLARHQDVEATTAVHGTIGEEWVTSSGWFQGCDARRKEVHACYAAAKGQY